MFDDLISYGGPVAGAVIAGGAIGFEREWRGRAAGFRTHILVSLASCLLMLAAMAQADWAFRALPNENIVTDPTRMAHGVLTGIGFLCAGVIFRTGFSVHGLTTAASLWVTSAVGLLFGAGLYALGAVGTVITALILGLLRLVDRRLPRTSILDVTVQWEAGSDPQPAVEALLRVRDPDLCSGAHELVDGGRARRRSFRLSVADEAVPGLAEALAAAPGVTGFAIDPRGD